MKKSGLSWYEFTIGARRAWIVSDGPIGEVLPLEEFPLVPEAEMRDILQANHLPVDQLHFEQNCLVVEGEGGLMLFDTGMGASDLFGPYAGRLLSSFREAGLSTCDVKAVFLTHCHADHIFGIASDDGKAAFPNATLYLSEADHRYWTSGDTADRDDFCALNVRGVLERVPLYGENVHFIRARDEPLPGVTVMATPGHTIGHLSCFIGAGQEKTIIMGDTANNLVISFARPEWHSSFDTDPDIAAKTRADLLALAAGDRLRVIGYHFPFPGIGHVERMGAGFRYIPEPMNFRRADADFRPTAGE